MNYCSSCGAKVALKIPDGDDRPRYVCTDCGLIHYQNPLMVVGCIPRKDDRILLCRRAIEPGYGKWTLPAGYLEKGETVEQGAKRELMEETSTSATDLRLYGLYDIPHIGQVYLMFRAAVASMNFRANAESLEAHLFEPDKIPWDLLAFPVIEKTLENYVRDARLGRYPFHIDRIDRSMAGVQNGGG